MVVSESEQRPARVERQGTRPDKHIHNHSSKVLKPPVNDDYVIG